MKTAPVSALPGMLLRDVVGVGTTGEEAVRGVVDGGVKMSSGLDDEGCVAAARTALLSGLQQPSTDISSAWPHYKGPCRSTTT